MTAQKSDRAALRRARDLMLERGELSLSYLVSTLLVRSWQRSVDAGLAPDGRLPDAGRLSNNQLAQARDRQNELIAHARPIMEYLHAQTRNSDSMVTLADDKGVLLEVLGDSEFLSRAERVSLSPGTSWHESHRGTNAIGTALAESRPVVVHGGEHFLERNGFLSCAAAPLIAPDGRLLGVLNISNAERQRHPHASGLVRAAAQVIENRLFDARHAKSIRLRFHPMAEGIGTFGEGIAAVSDDGMIIGANQAGLVFLGLRIGDIKTTPLSRLLTLRLEDLIDWARRRPGEPLLVTLNDGERLFMRPDPILNATPISVPPPSSAMQRLPDALDRLNTGDERLAAAIEKAHKLIGKPISLLLQGEPGVGKESFARACHASWPSRTGPFVAVNCAALRPEQVEAELFGTAPLTPDSPCSPGRILEAQGGILFIDEVECMPKQVQARMLDLLVNRRVKSAKGESVAVDVVIITATHSNLKAAIEAGNFDADFYYRINGMTINMVSLRERQDFPALVARLLEDFAPGRGVSLEPSVAKAFAEYAWPGNLRQLSNALSAACSLLDESETRIGWCHLPDDLAEELRWQAPPCQSSGGETTENLRELSQSTITRAIALSHGNMSEAARRLGISRNTLYRRLRQDPAAANSEI
ncbi:sigma-54-dependent Fis family transcriptional regulator [Uliginosibacterium gangwonense]|uniref:sigma-54-dependent Fis family transcriptional regulator n=1 Tax=Uliginosibacterium gangwonense TaxID=392736 RepID=UPI0003710927|nr:sigma-54-dependent Fis family transcriptional regulator [Uliginosibacterium gangwonense]